MQALSAAYGSSSEDDDPPDASPARLATLAFGARCRYRITAETDTAATVTGVHYDDPPEPYYSIWLDDQQRSRQTVRARLEPLARFAPPEAGDIETAAFWYYRDDGQQLRGPFSTAQLREWADAGYIRPTTSLAPSYYGEMPSQLWPLAALWERPAEAFRAPGGRPPVAGLAPTASGEKRAREADGPEVGARPQTVVSKS